MKNLFPLILLLPLLNYAQVKKDTIISVISLERNNVLYRGILNPIKIAVPNAKSFTVNTQGLTRTDSIGNYYVTTISDTTAIINIEAIMADGSIIKEKKEFYVKDIPHPKGIIDGQNCLGCIVRMTKEELADATVAVDFGEIIFENSPISAVNRFFLTYHPTQESISVRGNKMDKNAKKLISKLKAGDTIYIHDFGVIALARWRYKAPYRIEVLIVELD